MPNQDFIAWYLNEIRDTGWDVIAREKDDVWLLTQQGHRIWVCYVSQPLTTDAIRKAFMYPGYVLFVLDTDLIYGRTIDHHQTPEWLRVLHGLYMGRVYGWDGDGISGFHFDYDTNELDETDDYLDPSYMRTHEGDTWLRGWAGIYRKVLFDDHVWWKGGASSSRQSQQQRTDEFRRQQEQNRQYWQNAYNEFKKRMENDEQWRKEHHYSDWSYYTNPPRDYRSKARREYEDSADAYRKAQEARERAQRTRYDSSGYAYDPNDWPNGFPPSPPPKDGLRDFLAELLNCGSLDKAKARWRVLALEFHPDRNPDKDTTADMQRLNAAWDKAQRMLV